MSCLGVISGGALSVLWWVREGCFRGGDRDNVGKFCVWIA